MSNINTFELNFMVILCIDEYRCYDYCAVVYTMCHVFYTKYYRLL